MKEIKIKIKDFKELVNFSSKPDNLRPTLYDFLAHKAIDFYSNTDVQTNLKRILQSVENNKISPFEAANELIDIYFKKKEEL